MAWANLSPSARFSRSLTNPGFPLTFSVASFDSPSHFFGAPFGNPSPVFESECSTWNTFIPSPIVIVIPHCIKRPHLRIYTHVAHRAD
jgi:hypothetical protein